VQEPKLREPVAAFETGVTEAAAGVVVITSAMRAPEPAVTVTVDAGGQTPVEAAALTTGVGLVSSALVTETAIDERLAGALPKGKVFA
jgi:hypothetical protein